MPPYAVVMRMCDSHLFDSIQIAAYAFVLVHIVMAFQSGLNIRIFLNRICRDLHFIHFQLVSLKFNQME